MFSGIGWISVFWLIFKKDLVLVVSILRSHRGHGGYGVIGSFAVEKMFWLCPVPNVKTLKTIDPCVIPNSLEDFGMFLPADCRPKTAHARRVFLMDGVGWGGVGQDVTVMWTSAHTWCYATDIFSRLSYIFHATLGWGGRGKMLPACELLHVLDATLPTSSLDLQFANIFHATLRWGGVGQDVTVVWTSAHTWRYATDIFSRLSYIFRETQ